MTTRRAVFVALIVAVLGVTAGPATATPGPRTATSVAQPTQVTGHAAAAVRPLSARQGADSGTRPGAARPLSARQGADTGTRPGAAPGTGEAPAAKRRAAVGCVGTDCQGKFAADEGCKDDRIQVAGVAPPANNGWAAANFTLWHSPACRSAWAEYDSNGDASGRVLRLQSITEYGLPGTLYEVQIGGPGNYPTPMVTWDDSVRVCDSYGGPCTRWR